MMRKLAINGVEPVPTKGWPGLPIRSESRVSFQMTTGDIPFGEKWYFTLSPVP